MQIRSVLSALAALCLVPAVAEAEGVGAAPAECPADAEQTLFNYQLAIQSGQFTDAHQVFNLAHTAHTLCPDRPDVQGLAVEFFFLLGDAAGTPADQLAVYGKAYEAAVLLDTHFEKSGVEVSAPDGSSHKFYPYGPVFLKLENTIIPRLAALMDTGQVHAIFLDIPLEACPYVQDKGSGVQYEARAIAFKAPVTSADGVHFISGRLQRLQAACPDQAGFLSWALAEYHNRAAFALDDGVQKAAALENARAALRHARDYLSTPDRSADADNRAFSIHRVRAGIHNRFPESTD